MRILGYSGVWEIFVPGLHAGEKYKFEVLTQQGERLVKADPMLMPVNYAQLQPLY